MVALMCASTSPQRGGKLPFSIALICTTSRRIPAIASTNQGPEKGDLVADEAVGVCGPVRGPRLPPGPRPHAQGNSKVNFGYHFWLILQKLPIRGTNLRRTMARPFRSEEGTT